MKKVLVANRSEIAIRCFRAVTELGLQTVAVYSYEDRFSLHRFKADEAFLIGPPAGGEPVRSYLNIPAIIEVAERYGADAIHPGYGFLSENAEFARACERAGITFVGPTPNQLDVFGDKVASKRLATKADVPTVPGTDDAVAGLAAALAAAKTIGYPIIIKATFGGGGRGMRVVENAAELAEKIEAAQREAGAAFGRSDVFVERFVRRAKHIEVQVLGDRHGNLVHVWERDCSVQRRHQKVVEIAPSINLPLELRRRMCDDAVRLCREVRYQGAGTVEFLVDLDRQKFYFIEVNPRIQVEHTVTEMVSGIDLVRAQILIAQGHALHDPPLAVPTQDHITTNGVALQCRITTEDPENHFIPDYGRLSTYRSPGGFAVRLDGGNGFGGAVITPYFDSLLVKMTTWGQTLEEAVRRADRSLREFRIRGVKTNIAFLGNLILHPTFMSGNATTEFVDSTPELFRFRPPRDRANKILSYLGDVTVNGRPDLRGLIIRTRPLPDPIPPAVSQAKPPDGLRQTFQHLGPEQFATWVRAQKRLLFTDTTMRDAHQSLLATRVRTYDMLAVAPAVAHRLSGLFSLEMWGGATFDASMRFLQEDPWERLVQLRARIPNILFQMLLRASNTVGYTNYPDNVVREFIKKSSDLGIDLFRIFDSLNSTSNMKVAIDAVRTRTASICEAAICYTGDILDPARTKYSLKYYVKHARDLEKMGAHILGIKDMAGLCRPYAAYALVKALRDEVGLPIHFHTHDTSGVNAASVLRAADAGVDIVDAALSSMSGMTSQPNLNSLAAALRHTPRDSQLDQDALDELSDYWAAVRELYYPFEEGLKAPASDVYRHEMPGGQFTNLRSQAKSLGLESRWREIAGAYAAANLLLGDIVKVTPSSKVVGDLALFMVTNNLTAEDLLNAHTPLSYPKSVVEMLQGLLGEPEGGWPRKFQKAVLASARAAPIKGRPGAKLPKVDFAAIAKELSAKIKRAGHAGPTTPASPAIPAISVELVLSYVLYPQVFLDFADHRKTFGDTSVVPTRPFFFGLQPGEEIAVEIEEGKTLIIRLLTVGEVKEDGTRTIFFELNGQPREVRVADRAADAKVARPPKADPDDANHVAAPMPGKISSVAVKKAQKVQTGDRLLSIEAMKMETAVYTPRPCQIAEILVKPGMVVEARDLLVILEG